MLFRALANKDKRRRMIRPAIIALAVMTGLTYAEHIAKLIQEKDHEQYQSEINYQDTIQDPRGW